MSRADKVKFIYLLSIYLVAAAHSIFANPINSVSVSNDVTFGESDSNDWDFPVLVRSSTTNISVQIRRLVVVLNQKLRDNQKHNNKTMSEEELIGDGRYHVHDFKKSDSKKTSLRSNL